MSKANNTPDDGIKNGSDGKDFVSVDVEKDDSLDDNLPEIPESSSSFVSSSDVNTGSGSPSISVSDPVSDDSDDLPDVDDSDLPEISDNNLPEPDNNASNVDEVSEDDTLPEPGEDSDVDNDIQNDSSGAQNVNDTNDQNVSPDGVENPGAAQNVNPDGNQNAPDGSRDQAMWDGAENAKNLHEHSGSDTENSENGENLPVNDGDVPKNDGETERGKEGVDPDNDPLKNSPEDKSAKNGENSGSGKNPENVENGAGKDSVGGRGDNGVPGKVDPVNAGGAKGPANLSGGDNVASANVGPSKARLAMDNANNKPSAAGNVSDAKGAASGDGVAGKVANKAAEKIASDAPEDSYKKHLIERAEKIQKARRSAQNAKNVASGIKSFFSALPGILFNPVSIAIYIAIILLFLIIGFFQVVGKNENIENCIVTGPQGDFAIGKSAYSLSEEEKQKNALTAASMLASYPMKAMNGNTLTKEQIAGIIGNMWQESQMNPGAIQSNKLSPTASNAEVKALNGKGASAVGLFQMTNSRMLSMVNHAESTGRHWSDGSAQIEYLLKEINGEFPEEVWRFNKLKQVGFFEAGKPVQEYTRLWNRYFEGSCDQVGPDDPRVSCGESHSGYDPLKSGMRRLSHASWVESNFNGAASGVSGSAGSNCVSTSVAGNKNVVDFAISIAYPKNQRSSAMTGIHNGTTAGSDVVPQAYRDAKTAAQEKGGKDGLPNLFASCDRFVATVIKNTVDPQIPWGPTSAQYTYLSTTPTKWKPYHSKSEAKPGDIFITPGVGGSGHVVIYLGVVDGVESVADASYNQRVGVVGKAPFTENLTETYGSRRQYTGFHFVGGAGSAQSTDNN